MMQQLTGGEGEGGGRGWGGESHLPLMADRSDVDPVDLVSAATGAPCVQGFAVFAALGPKTRLRVSRPHFVKV